MVAQSALATNGAEAKAKRTRKKGDDLDVRVEFVDAKNQRSKSIPADPHAIVVIDKAKKEQQYSLREIPPTTMIQLVASELKRRAKGLKVGDKSILDQATAMFTAAKTGKLFVREAGAVGPGRTFDPTHIHEAVVRAYNYKQEKAGKKPLSAKETANLLVQIQGYNAADRKKAIDAWKKDSVVKHFYNKIQSERSEAALKNASGSAEDLLNI